MRKAFEIESFKCQPMYISYIAEHLDNLDIRRIELDVVVDVSGTTVSYTDREHPIVFSNDYFYNKTLCIDKEYYERNKEAIDTLIVQICRNSKSEDFTLGSTSLIHDEVLHTLLENQNIKHITLGNSEDVYVLDLETYHLLKNTHVESIKTNAVCDALGKNFDPFIICNQKKYLIGENNYAVLSTSDYFSFTHPLNSEELENIQYIKDTASMTIKFGECNQVVEIINKIDEFGKKGKISICIEDKNSFNSYLFKHINEFKKTDNVYVNMEGAEYDLLTYLKYEKELTNLILPVILLSPFEKYLFAYNVVKKFKEYKENDNNLSDSRDLYKILDNDYIVCVGFSNLLGDLLDKLGIESSEYSVGIEKGLDKIVLDTIVLPDYAIDKNEVLSSKGKHARRNVHLEDPKYGISGYYIADPTWDNEMENDAYNYALMTNDEMLDAVRYNYINIGGCSELFFVHSLEEFYEKLNMLLDKNPNRDIFYYINALFLTLKSMDKAFTTKLVEKYPFIGVAKENEIEKEIIQDILLELGEHIVMKVNNRVSSMQLRDGISTLYKYVYDIKEEELENKVNEVLEYNKKRQEIEFPVRYKINQDGRVEMFASNGENKFDIKEERKKKAA